MATLANTLKSEIARVARKELKSDLQTLKQALATQRSEIIALKRLCKTLTGQLKHAAKAIKSVERKASTGPAAKQDETFKKRKIRFNPKSFAALRAKLGLTQAKLAQLLNVSSISVYNWEAGKTQPREAQLEKIAAIRSLGKREAAAKLSA